MRWHFDPFSHVRRPPFGHRQKKDSSCLHYYHDLSICLGRAWQLGKTERKPTADNDSFQPKRHCFHPVRDFLHQASLLNVSSEKGDHSTRSCYGDVNQMMPLGGQPKRFSFHMETNAKATQVRPRNWISQRLKAMIVRWGCTRESMPSWKV